MAWPSTDHQNTQASPALAAVTSSAIASPVAGTSMMQVVVSGAMTHAGGAATPPELRSTYGIAWNGIGNAGIGGATGCAASGLRGRAFTNALPANPACAHREIIIVPIFPSCASPRLYVLTPSSGAVEMRNTLPGWRLIRAIRVRSPK